MTTIMPSLRLALLSLLLVGGATGSLLAQNALCVVHDGQSYVVQKVNQGLVYIEEGNKLVSIRPVKSGLVPIKEYYPALVSVRDLNVNTFAVGTGASTINNELQFSATFASGYFLEDAYFVLQLDMAHGVKRIFQQEIGDLKPGKSRPIRLAVPLAEELGSGHFTLHVFTQGREVFNSTQPMEYREGVLDQMVMKRIEKVKDAAPQPMIGPVAEFPASLLKQRTKGEALVAIRITRKGAVADPQVLQATDPAFGDAALAAVRLWRFLPRVENGQPVETSVNVPFHFEPPAESGKS